jgi:hypothetical protein
MKDFFSQNNMRKELAHYAAKTKELCIFNLENIEYPQLMDVRQPHPAPQGLLVGTAHLRQNRRLPHA